MPGSGWIGLSDLVDVLVVDHPTSTLAEMRLARQHARDAADAAGFSAEFFALVNGYDSEADGARIVAFQKKPLVRKWLRLVKTVNAEAEARSKRRGAAADLILGAATDGLLTLFGKEHATGKVEQIPVTVLATELEYLTPNSLWPKADLNAHWTEVCAKSSDFKKWRDAEDELELSAPEPIEEKARKRTPHKRGPKEKAYWAQARIQFDELVEKDGIWWKDIGEVIRKLRPIVGKIIEADPQAPAPPEDSTLYNKAGLWMQDAIERCK